MSIMTRSPFFYPLLVLVGEFILLVIRRKFHQDYEKHKVYAFTSEMEFSVNAINRIESKIPKQADDLPDFIFTQIRVGLIDV